MIEIPPWPSSRTIETKTGQGHASRGLLELGFYVHSSLVHTFVWQADLCLEKVCAAGSTSTGACSFTLCCCTFGKSCLALLLVFCFFLRGSAACSGFRAIDEANCSGNQGKTLMPAAFSLPCFFCFLPCRVGMAPDETLAARDDNTKPI